jgi:hypothetical protein
MGMEPYIRALSGTALAGVSVFFLTGYSWPGSVIVSAVVALVMFPLWLRASRKYVSARH